MLGELGEKIKGLFGVKPATTEADRAEELSRIVARREVDAMMQKEAEHTAKSREHLGDLVSAIHFQVSASAEDADYFPDGVVPWISIEERVGVRDRLLDGQEIVLQTRTAKVLIDYPLDNPTSLSLVSDSASFSRWQLIDEIGKKYEEIYLEEESSAETKTLPMSERRIMNRNQTDGTYGIWGHDLGDLAISLIEVRKDANGSLNLWLGLES